MALAPPWTCNDTHRDLDDRHCMGHLVGSGAGLFNRYGGQ